METIVEHIDSILKTVGERHLIPAEEIVNLLLDLRLIAVEESLAHSS